MKTRSLFSVLFCFIAIIFFAVPLAAQEIEEIAEHEQETRQFFPTQFSVPHSAGEFFSQWKPSFALEPTFILSDASPETSVPFAIAVPLTVGLFWQNDFFITTEPNLSFFMNYYLWDEKSQMAYIAEPEVRTALGLSFLFDLPLIFSLNITRNSNLKLFASMEILMRVGILSGGVKEEDFGTSGSAGGDLQKINDWLAQNIMYMGFGGSWMFEIGAGKNKMQLGPEVRVHMPLTQFGSTNGLMFSGGLKIIL